MRVTPNYARAATMAYRCLVRLNVRELPVRPMDMLRRCRLTRLFTYGQAAAETGVAPETFFREYGEADAFTCCVEGSDGQLRHIVCYRETDDAARLNFTLAHELGHVVLRHTGNDVREEAEANYFACHLLCPRPILRRLMAQGQPLYAEQIALTCHLSLSASAAVCRCAPCSIDPVLEGEVDALFSDVVLRRLPPKPNAYWHPVSPVRCIG